MGLLGSGHETVILTASIVPLNPVEEVADDFGAHIGTIHDGHIDAVDGHVVDHVIRDRSDEVHGAVARGHAHEVTVVTSILVLDHLDGHLGHIVGGIFIGAVGSHGEIKDVVTLTRCLPTEHAERVGLAVSDVDSIARATVAFTAIHGNRQRGVGLDRGTETGHAGREVKGRQLAFRPHLGLPETGGQVVGKAHVAVDADVIGRSIEDHEIVDHPCVTPLSDPAPAEVNGRRVTSHFADVETGRVGVGGLVTALVSREDLVAGSHGILVDHDIALIDFEGLGARPIHAIQGNLHVTALDVGGVVPAAVVILEFNRYEGVTSQVYRIVNLEPAILNPACSVVLLRTEQVGVHHHEAIVGRGGADRGNGVRTAGAVGRALPVDAVDVVGVSLVVCVVEGNVRAIREIIRVNDVTGVVNALTLSRAGIYGTSGVLANRCLGKCEADDQHREDQSVKVLHYVCGVGFVRRI